MSSSTKKKKGVRHKTIKKKEAGKKNEISREEKAKMWAEMCSNDRKCKNPYSMNQQEMKEIVCPRCCNSLLSTEEGYPVCVNKECGYMIRDIVDSKPEWRSFSVDDKTSTNSSGSSSGGGGGSSSSSGGGGLLLGKDCNKPSSSLLGESSFGCKILCNEKSSFEMKKIRQWTEWHSVPHREKSLYEEFQFITIIAQNAGIPKKFIEDAMIIHKEISEQKMFRGLNRDAMKSASIYISCRLNGTPRTSHEIAMIFNLDKTSATTGCSMAVNIYHNIERAKDPYKRNELANIKITSFIQRYCSPLNVNSELTYLALFIAKKIEENHFIFDNTPHSIASAIIYFISENCNLNISKKDIKKVCDVSEVTINKCFKKLEAFKDTFIPISILKKYKKKGF